MFAKMKRFSLIWLNILGGREVQISLRGLEEAKKIPKKLIVLLYVQNTMHCVVNVQQDGASTTLGVQYENNAMHYALHIVNYTGHTGEFGQFLSDYRQVKR